MQTGKRTYHPISMLPIVAHAINGSYENTSQLVNTFKGQEGRSGTLYDAELERALNSFQVGLRIADDFKDQLQRWEKTPLSADQKKEVSQLTKTANQLTKLYNNGIVLVARLSPYTIDKMRGKNNKPQEDEAAHKMKAIKELEACEEYLVISIGAENSKGYRDTNIHLSNIPLIEEAMKNLFRDNPRFRDMLLDVVLSP